MIFIKDKSELIQAMQKFDAEIIIASCDGLIGLSNALGSLNDNDKLGRVLQKNDLMTIFRTAERLDNLTQVLGMFNEGNIIIAEKLDRSLSKIYNTLEWRRVEELDKYIDHIENASREMLSFARSVDVKFRKYDEFNKVYIEKAMTKLLQSQEQFTTMKRDNRRTIASIEKMKGANWYRQLGNIEINFAEAISIYRNILRT